MKPIQNLSPSLRSLIFFLILTLYTPAFAQELPPMLRFNSSSYGGGNQNWMVSQAPDRFMYFANNEGLLQYNGSEWTLYPSPNETIIRSVQVVGERIYTGCYMEFGYWKKQSSGRLQYHSLSKQLGSSILEDEQFWNILEYDKWIIFQSLNRIYIYNTEKNHFKIITPKTAITKVYKAGNGLYFQTIGEGLFEIENGRPQLLSSDPLLIHNKIVGISPEADGLLLHTQFNGFYKLINGKVSKWITDADEALGRSSVYSSQILSDGGIALGCVSNGIFILSREGKVRYHITQNTGLGNNTALSLFEDLDKNLWVGLDNGISCVNLQSAIRSFVDDTGVLGTVYTSIVFEEMLYIGTNQGLFAKPFGKAGSYEFINGTKGQVWSLSALRGTLFCGHDVGTFIVKGKTANRIFNQSGTWKLATVPHRPDLLLQGNYYGISVLENKNGSWLFRNKLQGFDFSSKYFELYNGAQMIVSHEYKGVYRLIADPDFRKITKTMKFETPEKGKNAGLATFAGRIYYANKQGVYGLDPKTSSFSKDNFLSRTFKDDEYTSGKIIPDESNKLWIFTRNSINYYSFGKLSAAFQKNVIPIPSSLTNSMSGYENISQIGRNNYLIGTTDGYYTLNTAALAFKNYNVSVTAVSAIAPTDRDRFVTLREPHEFDHDENNVSLSYTVPEYNKYITADYQYKLTGIQDEWGPWTGKSSAIFKNLPPGDYTFSVRARIGNVYSANTAHYKFCILKPWYQTNVALLAYALLMLVLAHFIHKAYRNYYQKQKEKLIEENNLLLEIKELENEQQLMKLRNEQLSQDVDSKNRELAVSTMSLIQKNELLALIKEDLKRTDEVGNRNIKSVITTINKNINEEDTWNVFKEAFNNADKDFLKKIKQFHPSLTPNDLRLCAYLRLNLSSKEIAPLLNISVRSVEIKRYRLRKKMDLSHEKGLVEYILSI